MNMKNLKIFLYLIVLSWTFLANSQVLDLDRLYRRNREEVADVLKYTTPINLHDQKIIGEKISTHLRLNNRTLWNKSEGTFVKPGLAERYYIESAWKILTDAQRIRNLTLEIRQKLGIPQKHCPKENTCYDLVAVYLPISNMILVDYNELNDEAISRVYHELYHAYQYMFRYPLDIGMIFDFTRYDEKVENSKPELEINEINDYLNFYYESIANWKTLQFTKDKSWLTTSNSEFYSAASGLLKGVVNTFSLNLLSQVSVSSSKKWLSQEYIDEYSTGENAEKSAYSEHSFLRMPDLLVIKDLKHMFTLQNNLDFQFHLNYTGAIESAYFGNHNFLSRRKNGDQNLFSRMHDNVYFKLKRNFKRDLIENENCLKPLARIIYSETSPLLSWFSTSSSEFMRCEIYNSSSFWNARDQLLMLYLDFNDHFFHNGTKGTGGPMLRIQPQIIVKPPKDKK